MLLYSLISTVQVTRLLYFITLACNSNYKQLQGTAPVHLSHWKMTLVFSGSKSKEI